MEISDETLAVNLILNMSNTAYLGERQVEKRGCIVEHSHETLGMNATHLAC